MFKIRPDDYLEQIRMYKKRVKSNLDTKGERGRRRCKV